MIVHSFHLEAMQPEPLDRCVGVAAVFRFDRDLDHGALGWHVKKKAAVMHLENVRPAAA